VKQQALASRRGRRVGRDGPGSSGRFYVPDPDPGRSYDELFGGVPDPAPDYFSGPTGMARAQKPC